MSDEIKGSGGISPPTADDLKARFAQFSSGTGNRFDGNTVIALLPAAPSTGENKIMNTPSREEIEARLKATEATVDSRLATLEKTIAESLANMRVDIASMHTAVVSEIGAVAVGVGEIRGEIGGLKSSIGMLQWFIAGGIAVAALVIGYLQFEQAKTQSASTPSAPVMLQAPSTAPVVAAPKPAEPIAAQPQPSTTSAK